MSAAAAKVEIEQVRKITPKIVMGGRPKLVNNKRTELATFAGVANRAKSVPGSFGESIRFSGEFVAVNLTTGQAYKSNSAYFPRIVEEELAGPVLNGQEVEFAFKLVILPDDKSNTGYVYVNEPIHNANNSEKLAKLAKLIGVNTNPQLPAPDKSDKTEDKGKGKK